MVDCKTLMLLLFIGVSNGIDQQPEQIHLSFTGNITEMVVTWATLVSTPYSIVEYNMVGEKPFSRRATGSVTKFTDGGSEKRVEFIHRVKLTGLIPDRSYEYHCGGNDGWSSVYKFTAMKDGVNWSPRIALYGDLGVVNAKSLSYVQQEVQRGDFDAILHVGDFAYDMYEDNARVGDDFLNQVQTIAAYVPYMTCPGNHENHYNFSNYKNRFTMPGNADSMFYRHSKRGMSSKTLPNTSNISGGKINLQATRATPMSERGNPNQQDVALFSQEIEVRPRKRKNGDGNGSTTKKTKIEKPKKQKPRTARKRKNGKRF